MKKSINVLHAYNVIYLRIVLLSLYHKHITVIILMLNTYIALSLKIIYLCYWLMYVIHYWMNNKECKLNVEHTPFMTYHY